MRGEFVVRDLFKLSSGTTVLACEGSADGVALSGRIGKLLDRGQVRQSVVLIGERQMLNQATPSALLAIETHDVVNLSADEARSGHWTLLIED